MSGFRVDTNALAGSGAKYRAAGKRLADSAGQLRAARETLRTQTVGEEVAKLLRDAARVAEETAAQARELGIDCEQIADVYERTERQVSSVVEALSQAATAFTAVGATTASNLTTDGIFEQAATRVASAYKPADPVLISGNRLPSEGWLLSRALRAQAEKQQ